MKAKKKIRGVVIPPYLGAERLLILPIGDIDALIFQIAESFADMGIISYPHTKCDMAKAALRSIGVPLKGRK